jgi:hypothetical protein
VLAKECFRILGVAESAPESEIKRAYRRMVMQLHPDTGQRPDSLAFSRVVEAYRSISNFRTASRIIDFPPRRERYSSRTTAGRRKTEREENRRGKESLHDIGTTLLYGKTPYLRSFAAMRLGNSGRRSSYVYLRQGLHDRDSQVVISSVKAIGKLKIDYAAPELTSLFFRGDNLVRIAILETIGVLEKSAGFRGIILSGMQDDSSVIRRRSLSLFKNLQQQESRR